MYKILKRKIPEVRTPYWQKILLLSGIIFIIASGVKADTIYLEQDQSSIFSASPSAGFSEIGSFNINTTTFTASSSVGFYLRTDNDLQDRTIGLSYTNNPADIFIGWNVGKASEVVFDLNQSSSPVMATSSFPHTVATGTIYIFAYLGGDDVDYLGIDANTPAGYIHTEGEVGGFEGATHTRIIDFNPKDTIVCVGGPDPCPVDFDLTYYFNSAEDFGFYDRISLEFANLEPSGGMTYLPVYHDINVSGQRTTTGTYLLDHGHIWVIATFMNSETGFKGVAKSFQFVVGGSVSEEAITGQAPVGTPPGQESGLLFPSFLNVPHLITTKIPFSYAYEFYQIMRTTYDTSATSTMGAITVSFTGSTTPSALVPTFSNITLFSTSTVSSYLSDSIISLLRALLVAVIWTGAGFHVYTMVVKTTFRSRT